MIPDQWYAVLDSKEVKPGKPVGFTRMGQKLVFWRKENGEIGCLSDKCAHRGVQLSFGKVLRFGLWRTDSPVRLIIKP